MADVSTLPSVELGVLGPLQVRQGGAPVTIPGAKPRAILSMLGLHGGSVVAADTLVELLWGEDPPRTAAKALQTHISSLRRTLGDGFVLTAGAGWTLAETQVDASRYKSAARLGRDAAAAGDTSQAVARFEEALALWRGIPELPDGRRGTSEKTRWIEGHAALVEDRADALLATGRAAEIIGELEAAVADAPLRERRWGQLMLALYRAGRQGEALGAYQRARALLADELGVDPGPDLRRLEAAIVAQDCCAGSACRTTALVGDSRRDVPADRHRGVDGRLGGRRRRHGGGTGTTRRARRTGRHVTRRAADQDARRGRRHVLGLRAAVGGRRRGYRAARSDRPRAVGAAGAHAHPRGIAHRGGRAPRRRLLRSGGQPRRPPAVAGYGRPDPVLGCDRRARHRLTARRRRARRPGDAPAAQSRAPGARFRAQTGNRRRPSSGGSQPTRLWSARACPRCSPAPGRSSGAGTSSSDCLPRGRPRSPAARTRC